MDLFYWLIALIIFLVIAVLILKIAKRLIKLTFFIFLVLALFATALSFIIYWLP